MEISTVGDVKRISNEETFLHTLYKYTNYSIRVLAYTGAGDGVLSAPIFCTTEEDGTLDLLYCFCSIDNKFLKNMSFFLLVPGTPAGIKALALTADSILVSWLPPLQPNGQVIQYTVYSREAGASRHNSHTMHEPSSLSSDTLTMELRGLTERQLYEFWVSATTGVGEGEPTTIVTQTTNTRGNINDKRCSELICRC